MKKIMTPIWYQEHELQKFDIMTHKRLQQMAPREGPNSRRYLSPDDGSRTQMFIVA
jgi:hypothetical protein